MKKRRVLGCAAAILAAAGMLVLSGCPGDPPPDEGADGRLVSAWTNDPKNIFTDAGGLIGLKKTFEIRADSTFTAYINVIFLSAFQGAQIDVTDLSDQTNQQKLTSLVQALLPGAKDSSIDALKWTVTGKLTKIADETYYMAGLTAAGPDGTKVSDTMDLSTVTPALVGGFANVPVRLQVADGGNTFTFTSASNDAATNEQVDGFFGGEYTKVTGTP
ncbi:MAG: hypothetical protein LBE17_13670 [Treponema sp.]|nr:hypothetical protein [Treponema sp.]